MQSSFRNILNGLLVIITCILLVPSSYGQVQQTTFVPVAPEELSSAFMRCIYKDSKGFMWFGTANGLVRFDGTNVYRYEHNPADRKSLPNNRINAIVEDIGNNLWIGTAQGLVIYQREKDHFIDVDSITQNKNHLNNKYISSLAIDREGKVWIGTHGRGINVYNPKTYTFTHLTEPSISNRLAAGNYIISLLHKNDTVWAGTRGGLKFFDTRQYKTLTAPIPDESITAKEITQVVADTVRGTIWLGTAGREIIKLSNVQGRYEARKIVLEKNMYGETGGDVLTLSINLDGNLWIGGENIGLNLLDAKSLKISYYEPEAGDSKKLPTNSIRSIYVDNTGITWIGTYNRGAFLIDNNAKKFYTYKRNLFLQKGLISNSVKGIAEDQHGSIWVAFDGGGLGKLNAGSDELLFDEGINKKLATKYLSYLLYDSENNLWIGTFGKGLYKLNLKTSELKHYMLESHGFGDNKVACIYEDSENRIWVGSVGSGLFYLDSGADKFVPFNSQNKPSFISKTGYVTTIMEDSNHFIWVGTLFGLYKLQTTNNTFNSTVYLKNSLPGSIGSNEILTIHEDAENNLLFGTGDNGVAILPSNGSGFRMIREGLLSNTIRGIVTGAAGTMWMSGDKGLIKYHPITQAIRNYTKEDGIPSNEFNANAVLRATDGKLYFGSDNGLVIFHPDSIRNNTIRPIIYLTDLKINNQSVGIGEKGSPLQKHISLTTAIELVYSQRSFVIDFAAINYGQSSRNSYWYKLEGFDSDWNRVGSNMSATYTNLDPGHYVFYVKAYNSDGMSSVVPAKLEITIYPAPWKTWWAILLYLLFSGLLVFYLIKIRNERIRIKNQLELERLAREKEHALIESKTVVRH